MTIRAFSDADERIAGLYDSTTGMPLPVGFFESLIAAQHFLIWAERENRPPFDNWPVYDAIRLKASVDDWGKVYTDANGVLTEKGFDEWASE